jgi:putative flippase GtrA
MKRSFIRKLLGFGISGVLAFLVDFGFYWVATPWLGSFWAKQISFILATVASFLLNRKLTFGVTGFDWKRLALFILYYAVMVWVNPLLNEGFLHLSGNRLLAFLLATGISAVLNFSFQNTVVFRAPPNRNVQK